MQNTCGLPQFELSQQHLIASIGQVAFGLIELALRIEHIDIDANSHLVAHLVGFERALAGQERSFQCLDLGMTGLNAQKGRACRLLHRAARIIELGACFVLERHGLLDAVLYGKTGEQRHIHHHADLRRIGVRACREVGHHGAIGVAIDHITRLQIHGGFVSGLGLLGLQLRNVERQLGLAQLRLCAQGLIHPALHIVWLDLGQGHRRCQGHGLNADAAYQLIQSHALDLKFVLRRDLLGGYQVEA